MPRCPHWAGLVTTRFYARGLWSGQSGQLTAGLFSMGSIVHCPLLGFASIHVHILGVAEHEYEVKLDGWLSLCSAAIGTRVRVFAVYVTRELIDAIKSPFKTTLKVSVLLLLALLALLRSLGLLAIHRSTAGVNTGGRPSLRCVRCEFISYRLLPVLFCWLFLHNSHFFMHRCDACSSIDGLVSIPWLMCTSVPPFSCTRLQPTRVYCWSPDKRNFGFNLLLGRDRKALVTLLGFYMGMIEDQISRLLLRRGQVSNCRVTPTCCSCEGRFCLHVINRAAKCLLSEPCLV